MSAVSRRRRHLDELERRHVGALADELGVEREALGRGETLAHAAQRRGAVDVDDRGRRPLRARSTVIARPCRAAPALRRLLARLTRAASTAASARAKAASGDVYHRSRRKPAAPSIAAAVARVNLRLLSV